MNREHLLCICRALNERIANLKFEIDNESLYDPANMDAGDWSRMTADEREEFHERGNQIEFYKKHELPTAISALAAIKAELEK